MNDIPGTTMLLNKVKVDEHFIFQGIEYVRLGDKEEDDGIYCKNLKDGSSGLLSRDKLVLLKTE